MSGGGHDPLSIGFAVAMLLALGARLLVVTRSDLARAAFLHQRRIANRVARGRPNDELLTLRANPPSAVIVQRRVLGIALVFGGLLAAALWGAR